LINPDNTESITEKEQVRNGNIAKR